MDKNKIPNVLALDWGKVRIGVAILKKEVNVVVLREAILNNDDVFREIGKICKEDEVGKILVGIPYELRGEEKRSAEKARGFGKKIEEELKIEVEFFDERFTSLIAEKKLRGSKKENKKKTVDSLAAAEILEDWIRKNY